MLTLSFLFAFHIRYAGQLTFCTSLLFTSSFPAITLSPFYLPSGNFIGSQLPNDVKTQEQVLNLEKEKSLLMLK